MKFKNPLVVCVDCGKVVQRRSGRQIRCDECRAIESTAWNKRRNAEVSIANRTNKKCTCCGAIIPLAKKYQRVCDACTKLMREPIKGEKAKAKLGIIEIDKMGKEIGLTYGQMVVKLKEAQNDL